MNPNRIQQLLDYHLQIMTQPNQVAIDYWNSGASVSLTICGLAIAALFSLLALRRGDGSRVRFLEIPIAALLAISSLAFLVCWTACSTISESLLIAAHLQWGPPNAIGIENFKVAYNAVALTQAIGYLGLVTAVGLSGFLRNILLGITTLVLAVIAVLWTFGISMLPIVLFT